MKRHDDIMRMSRGQPAIGAAEPKTCEDGIAEGLERAARYHERMAELHDGISERVRNDRAHYSALASAHRYDAAAIRALKE